MKRLKAFFLAGILGATLAAVPSAHAWWGWGPWNGWGDGFMSFSIGFHGNGYGYGNPYYGYPYWGGYPYGGYPYYSYLPHGYTYPVVTQTQTAQSN